MRMKDEAKERNIDSLELQAFTEHLSANAPQYEQMDREELEQREMEKMTAASKDKKRISCVQCEDAEGNLLLDEKQLIRLS